MQDLTYGVPQESILEPLIFLIYVNNHQYASNLLEPSMFADDANLFYADRDVKKLFQTINNELQKIYQ